MLAPDNIVKRPPLFNTLLPQHIRLLNFHPQPNASPIVIDIFGFLDCVLHEPFELSAQKGRVRTIVQVDKR
ncbi:hypothetical protein ACFX2B_035483 [Malus domestica]